MLFWDFDGIMVDSLPAYDRAIRANGLDPNTRSIENHYFLRAYSYESILDDSVILYDNIEIIKVLIRLAKHPSAVLTHVNSVEEALIKVRVVNTYFCNLPLIPVPIKEKDGKLLVTKKIDIANPRDNLLVDDSYDNCDEWNKQGGVGVLYSSNSNDGIDDLKKLLLLPKAKRFFK